MTFQTLTAQKSCRELRLRQPCPTDPKPTVTNPTGLNQTGSNHIIKAVENYGFGDLTLQTLALTLQTPTLQILTIQEGCGEPRIRQPCPTDSRPTAPNPTDPHPTSPNRTKKL